MKYHTATDGPLSDATHNLNSENINLTINNADADVRVLVAGKTNPTTGVPEYLETRNLIWSTQDSLAEGDYQGSFVLPLGSAFKIACDGSAEVEVR